MHSDTMLFAVDDVESARQLLAAKFSRAYQFEAFDSAEGCLDRLSTRTPDLFLLDVDLPGMDGYALCREIKAIPALADTPVIFISALDDLESRLAGYDAGGIDFIVKPYRMAELQQKVELAINAQERNSALHRQLEESEMLTSLILSNLDEYALLIRFLRALPSCATLREVAEALLAMLASFSLSSAVQLRSPGTQLTIGAKGENNPLELSVIEHVKTLGTIFEFKARAAFNYAGVTILVNNMPVHDADLCGRLRDHLAIAAESADAKLEALRLRADNSHKTDEVATLLASVRDTLAAFTSRYAAARHDGTTLTQGILDELRCSFARLGMSNEQESSILSIVAAKSFELIDLYDFGDETQVTLRELADRLAGLIDAA